MDADFFMCLYDDNENHVVGYRCDMATGVHWELYRVHATKHAFEKSTGRHRQEDAKKACLKVFLEFEKFVEWRLDHSKRINVDSGKRYLTFMPHSEVCMHMRVAGRLMAVELLHRVAVEGDVARTFYMAQLYGLDGTPFSAPITTGEAGLLHDDRGFYIRPMEGWQNDWSLL